MTTDSQRANVRKACEALAPIALDHDLVISHGNGPQVGLLALQAAAYDDDIEYPFDVLGAQTEGMIGYLVEQELGNLLPEDKRIATLLTMTEVDPSDPAFENPTKFVGPGYSQKKAEKLAGRKGWVMKPDGDNWRRVVASPKPVRIFELDPIRWLLAHHAVVICAGGGGIPTMFRGANELIGADAVIDKDLASAVLARDLSADMLIIATDADAVYLDWGTPSQQPLSLITPDELERHPFPAGSMGPKVEAACSFARETGKPALIGALDQLAQMLAGQSGTRVSVV